MEVMNGITLSMIEELHNPFYKDMQEQAIGWTKAQLVAKKAVEEWLMAPTCTKGELSGKEWRAILEAQKK